MNTLQLIIALSAIMWYIIDQFKPLWSTVSHGRYVTVLVACLFACALVHTYNLDIVQATDLFEEITLTGKAITVLSLMSGSAAVSEIIDKTREKGVILKQAKEEKDNLTLL